MARQYNPKLTPRAQELRREATPQENHLWYDFLSKHPMRFLRQRVIGTFIADFYCHEARLVIEIDGSQHFTPEGLKYDKQRTAALETLNLRVIRFTNQEVDHQFDGVCRMIDAVLIEQLYPNKSDMDV